MSFAFDDPKILPLSELRSQVKWRGLPVTIGQEHALGYVANDHVLVWIEWMGNRYDVIAHACFTEKIWSTRRYEFPDIETRAIQALEQAYRVAVAVEHLPSLEIFDRVCREVLQMERDLT